MGGEGLLWGALLFSEYKNRGNEMKGSYIRFMAPVNALSTEALLIVVDSKLKDGYEKIHLMINSPGGSVAHGIAIHNILKSMPMECDTYNLGSVDSIGVVVFCGGKKRYAVPNSRFLMHPIQCNMQGEHSFDEHELRERIKGLEIDQENIIGVIAQTTAQEPREVERKMHERTTLNAEQSKQYGLVTDIADMPFIPSGAEIISIHESSAYPPRTIQLPIAGQIPVGKNENYTSMFDLGSSQTRAY